ncbi:MAG: 6,7-dimethyl-8-ribityllumazine synthase [Acidimicrobiia bacterium]
MKGPIVGDLDASSLHVGVAAALWNQAITDKLVDGALTRLADLGAKEVTLVRVPGALEVPLAAQKLAEAGCDAVIAIGAVVKGETDHYDIVVRESARGISRVALDAGVPVANAILAVHDYALAVARAGAGEANKGSEAVDAAVATANALRQVAGS